MHTRRPATAPRRRSPRSLPDERRDERLATEAVLLDALGTLVELEPPWPLLCSALATLYGIEVSVEEAKPAMLAEMSYYRAHHHEGRDGASLRDLRTRCAQALREHLPQVADLSDEELVEALLASLQFRPYPDAAPVLGRLRQLDVRSAVVSNWDVSLRDVLAELGLGGLVDHVVVSAEAGARKPQPAIVEQALRRLRCPPGRALMVGDSPETDIAAAQAAGVRGVLIDRAGTGAEAPGVERIFTLATLPELLAAKAT